MTSQCITDAFCLLKDMLNVSTYKEKQSDQRMASFITSGMKAAMGLLHCLVLKPGEIHM